jgi:uncharacterized protein (DUF2249 family)
VPKQKDKNYMIISINTEKDLDKIQHPFIIKTFRKLKIGAYLNIVYDKPIANIVLDGEKLKIFPLTEEVDKGVHSSPLFQYSTRILSWSNKV